MEERTKKLNNSGGATTSTSNIILTNKNVLREAETMMSHEKNLRTAMTACPQVKTPLRPAKQIRFDLGGGRFVDPNTTVTPRNNSTGDSSVGSSINDSGNTSPAQSSPGSAASEQESMSSSASSYASPQQPQLVPQHPHQQLQPQQEQSIASPQMR